MLNTKSFLGIDFGAGSLKIAEFDTDAAGALRLLRYATKPLGLAGAQDAAREGVVLRGLQELLADTGFTARNCNVCAPGFQVVSKFLKLPPVDSSKLKQAVQNEAQKHVPFPLDAVVWDYQLLGTLPSRELEVLLVAIKTELVEGFFKVAERQGLRLDVVDVSPACLCNSFRYNYGDLEGCTLLLDIGAKTSNVLFFERGKFYSRSINIGANSITQDFAAEFRMPYAEAEKLKIAEGFVSLGGAYEEPGSPRQAAISKIARQVLTRLHLQVSQTIQFYRSHQGGGAPQRLLLAGGASIMPCAAQFFNEKLTLPVGYFNPFRNLQIDPSVDLEELGKVAHTFGEVVGVGLRRPAQCPVELNLVPKSILERQQFNQKKPYFIAAVCSMILAVSGMGWFFDQVAAVKQGAIDDRTDRVTHLLDREKQLNGALDRLKRRKGVSDQLTDWMQGRFTWVDLITDLRRALVAAEDNTKRPGIRTAVWIEKMAPENIEAQEAAEDEDGKPKPMMDLRMAIRYGLLNGVRLVPDPTAAGAATNVSATKPKDNTNELSVVYLTCRGVSWKKVRPSADSEVAIALLKELESSPYFVSGTNGTQLAGQMKLDETGKTFTFDVRLKLKKPVRL